MVTASGSWSQPEESGQIGVVKQGGPGGGGGPGHSDSTGVLSPGHSDSTGVLSTYRAERRDGRGCRAEGQDRKGGGGGVWGGGYRAEGGDGEEPEGPEAEGAAGHFKTLIL